MNLLQRYIFKKAGFATLMIVAALVGVIWLVQALREVDIITQNSQTLVTYLSITFLVVPNLALAIAPIALLLATIHTLNTLNANSELVVVSASGASGWSVAKPLIVLAVITSLFTGLVAHVVSPYSLQLVKKLVTEMRADLVSVVLREGQFTTVEDGLTFHVAKKGAAGLLSGIVISDDREKDTSSLFTAKEGIVIRNQLGSFLSLKDGDILQTNKEDNTTTIIKYESYSFDLSTFSGKTELGKLRIKERPTWDLLSPDPNEKEYQNNPNRYVQQIHERFSEMLWPFANVLVILAIAGQARSSRQGHSTSIFIGFSILAVARGLTFSFVSGLKTDPGLVWMVYGVPCACVVVGLYFVITNRTATLPSSTLQWYEEFSGKLIAQYEALLERYRLFRRKLAGVRS